MSFQAGINWLFNIGEDNKEFNVEFMNQVQVHQTLHHKWGKSYWRLIIDQYSNQIIFSKNIYLLEMRPDLRNAL